MAFFSPTRAPTRASTVQAESLRPNEYFILDEPYYHPVADEISVFEAAYQNQLPVLLKGPTGCGKTRFMEYMAWRLKRVLITVSCHDDLTASDLVLRQASIDGFRATPTCQYKAQSAGNGVPFPRTATQ